MPITDDAPAFERQGFLKEDFRLFHLKDKVSPCYEFHYHDFLKIMGAAGGKGQLCHRRTLLFPSPL